MKYFSVDRIEGTYAFLIDEFQETIRIERNLLPSDIAEGDILSFDGELYANDAAETMRRKKEIQKLVDELFE